MSRTIEGRGVEEEDAAPDIGDLDEHTGEQLPTGGIVPDLHRHCPPWRSVSSLPLPVTSEEESSCLLNRC